MQTKRLGKNGPEISVVGFGAWEIGGMWGSNPPEDDMIAAIRAGAEAGMNWVDTAEVYGKGYSEQIVGRAVAPLRDVMVFTKVAPKPVGTGFEPGSVRAACDASLTQLGRDVIDLYQLHWPDAEIPVEETWAAMVSLVEAGKVRWIGVSNFTVELLQRCQDVRHVDSLQPQFSMLLRDVQDEILPWCDRTGTGVISYGPLAYGMLTGTITADTTFEASDWRSGTMGMGAYERLFKPGVREEKIAIVDALRPIADRLGVSLAQLALAWNVRQPGVTGAIAGSRSASHTVENARAGDVTLSDKDLEEIEAVLAS